MVRPDSANFRAPQPRGTSKLQEEFRLQVYFYGVDFQPLLLFLVISIWPPPPGASLAFSFSLAATGESLTISFPGAT